jgi:hypothetical protein
MKMNFFTHEGEIVGQIVDENGIVVDDIYFFGNCLHNKKEKVLYLCNLVSNPSTQEEKKLERTYNELKANNEIEELFMVMDFDFDSVSIILLPEMIHVDQYNPKGLK